MADYEVYLPGRSEPVDLKTYAEVVGAGEVRLLPNYFSFDSKDTHVETGRLDASE